MPFLYCGLAFRRQHHITQIELAHGAGLRAATLVDLEKGRAAPTTDTLARIIEFFHAQGIPCEIGDLLVYQAKEAEEESDGRRDASPE